MALFATLPKPDRMHSEDAEPGWMTDLRADEVALWARVSTHGDQRRQNLSDTAAYVLADTVDWLADLPPNSIHAIVTDPPYGIIEYDEKNHKKLRAGRGGVWRIPPSFDGANRSPLPRF